MTHPFDRQHLQQLGFDGFEPLLAIPRSRGRVPARSGIYVVVLESASTPAFLDRSVGGHFKGQDPEVPIASLVQKFNPGVPTQYIGRATNLRDRTNLLARYGGGEPVAHRGGRYLWQLAAHGELLVAWRLEDDPVAAESELLEEFEAAVGRLPFANLVRGRRRVALAEPLARNPTG